MAAIIATRPFSWSLLWVSLLALLLLVDGSSLSQGQPQHLQEGDMVPNVQFFTRTRVANDPHGEFEWTMRSTDDYFSKKRVVLFALPGAFTPTCSATHLPGYEDAYLDIRALGVDDVYCTCVLSSFVWKECILEFHECLVSCVPFHSFFLSLAFQCLALFLLCFSYIFKGLSVNDAFVMRHWGLQQGLVEDVSPDAIGTFQKVKLLPDGAAAFTTAMGMLVPWDTQRGFGNRSWRYSMVRRCIHRRSAYQNAEKCPGSRHVPTF
jgi:thioredoxin-dependent peroxiredoxin